MGSKPVAARWLLAWLLAGLPGVRGQAPASVDPNGVQQPDAAAVPTLHAYANLEQIPVLVLSSSREPLKKPIPESRFRVSLDSGPEFRPTHVRLEADDPISLAVLIDATRPKSDLLPGVAEAIAELTSGDLRPRDRVSVYVMDCALTRTAFELPPNATALRKALDEGLAKWKTSQGEHTRTHCKPSMPLWDSLAEVTTQLRPQPGRRVVMAVTDGRDQGSRTKWNQVAKLMQFSSVAVFGIAPSQDSGTTVVEGGMLGGAMASVPSSPSGLTDDEFDLLCQMSGGLKLFADPNRLGQQAHSVMRMVRDRYIVEYPRADDVTRGFHTMVVSIGQPNLYVRSAGIAVPVADPKVLSDPTTVRSDPALQPPMGTRKALDPPH